MSTSIFLLHSRVIDWSTYAWSWSERDLCPQKLIAARRYAAKWCVPTFPRIAEATRSLVIYDPQAATIIGHSFST